MIDFIADNFYYVFLGWLVLNLIQRKYRERGSKKRTATLFQAVLFFILYIGATIIREEGFEEKWIIIPLGAIAALIYFFRDRILPYRRDCASCGEKLSLNQIFLYDANLCSKCDPFEQPDESDEDSQESEASEGTEDSPAESPELSEATEETPGKTE